MELPEFGIDVGVMVESVLSAAASFELETTDSVFTGPISGGEQPLIVKLVPITTSARVIKCQYFIILPVYILAR
jgi:hypothetical protein